MDTLRQIYIAIMSYITLDSNNKIAVKTTGEVEITNSISNPVQVETELVSYTRAANTYTSAQSPVAITSGKSSIMLLASNDFVGTVEGQSLPSGTVVWRDCIDHPNAILPALTITITTGTVVVYTKTPV